MIKKIRTRDGISLPLLYRALLMEMVNVLFLKVFFMEPISESPVEELGDIVLPPV